MHIIATATLNPGWLQIFVGKTEAVACERAAKALSRQSGRTAPHAADWRKALDTLVQDLPGARLFEGQSERDVTLPCFNYLKSCR